MIGAPHAGAASLDNYTISNYGVDIYLDKDSSNRSVMHVTETITGQFPQTDQNHGLERVFVKEYDHHDTRLQLESVTDGQAKPLNYHWQGDALRIGDKDRFVHGEQTYVIKYSQHDVTRYYSDTHNDEFYWDVIGTEWRVPIQNAEVKVHIADALAAQLKGNHYCYTGATGARTMCQLQNSGTTYTTNVTNLQPGQGVTVAFGFAEATFAAYQKSMFQQLVEIWQIAQFALAAISMGLMGWILVRFTRSVNRMKEMGTIVPEYLPPKNASVSTAAKFVTPQGSVLSAQLIDLAVRHYIKLSEVKEKTLFSKAQYEIQVLKDIADLKWEEREILTDIFGIKPEVGATLNLKKLQNNTSYLGRTMNNDKDLDTLIKGEYALKQEDPALKSWLRKVAVILVVVSAATLSPFILVAAITAFVCSFTAFRLTDEGLALKRYLNGLKMYIKVGEEERLKALQSPEGAEKVQEIGDMNDPKKRIVLYERLLPYAILFGNEKQWSKALGDYYEQSGTQPGWYYSHSGAFNAAAFSSGIAGVGTAASSASSYSSSSGGSSGGGSAGGGGGGGGGGGW